MTETLHIAAIIIAGLMVGSELGVPPSFTRHSISFRIQSTYPQQVPSRVS